MKQRLLIVAMSWIALVLQACGPQSGGDTLLLDASSSGSSTGPSLLEKIKTAPFEVAYSGKRRVEFRYRIGNSLASLEYTERVYSDGRGRYRIEPDDVAHPPMSATERDFFLLLQRERESFFYLHRDFRIRDLQLFLENYVVAQRTGRTEVAGRACNVLDVRLASGEGSRYRVEVDETGLVMRWREIASDGTTVARVEFTEFTASPDLTGVSWHVTQYPATALDLDDAVAQMGYAVPLPQILPDGYQPRSAERITGGGSAWANVVYGDGAEQLFYLYTQLPEAAEGTFGVAGHGDLGGADVVTVFQIGPWTAAVGEFHQKRIVVLGKVSETELLDMIQSALQ